MPPIHKTYIVLPAYNESDALSTLVPHIAQALTSASRPYEVLVVNDGSSDSTSPLIQSFMPAIPVRELCHSKNRGYGAALRTGFEWLLSHAGTEDAVVTLDADNTHDPKYIPSLISKLESGFDVVTASYSMKGGHAYGVPPSRRVMSSILNALLSIAFPLPECTTYTNGFRAYRISAMRKVQAAYPLHLIDDSGFPGGAEFFLKCAGLGAQVSEWPFDLHYENRGAGSKIRLFQTVSRYLKLLGIAFRLRS